jgi:tRNA uridine 5-carbamoylmethylation protein Kti12
MNPYEPTSTLLGRDTKKIADPRSVESLVDFRQSNLRWLKKAGDDEVGRLKKHQKEADEKRNQALIDNCIELEFSQAVSESIESVQMDTPATSYLRDYGDIPVDPALEKLDGSFLLPPEVIS